MANIIKTLADKNSLLVGTRDLSFRVFSKEPHPDFTVYITQEGEKTPILLSKKTYFGNINGKFNIYPFDKVAIKKKYIPEKESITGIYKIYKDDNKIVFEKITNNTAGGREMQEKTVNSEAGSVRIGNKDFSFLVWNGFGEGHTKVVVVDINSDIPEKEENLVFVTSVDGRFHIFEDDLKKFEKPQISLLEKDGLYYVFYKKNPGTHGTVYLKEVSSSVYARTRGIV